MSDDFETLSNGFGMLFNDGQSAQLQHGCISTPSTELTPPEPVTITFVLNDEQLEYFRAILEKVSENFRNFLDAVTQTVTNLHEHLKALGLLDIDWDAINAQAEAAEKAHAKRFKMYQRRYERGKTR